MTIISGGSIPKGTPDDYAIPDAVKYRFVGNTPRNTQMFEQIKYHALRELALFPFDCIISRSSTAAPLLRANVAKKENLPPIFLNEGSLSPRDTVTERTRRIVSYGFLGSFAFSRNQDSAFQLAHHTVAISRAVAENLRDLQGIPDNKLSVIPRGVNIDFFSPRHKLDRPQRRPFRLMFAGNVTQRKGATDLVTALRYLDSCGSSTEIVFCGNVGERYQAKLEGIIGKKSSHHISFLGPLTPLKLLEEYRKADAFVLPSYEEGQGKVVIEAMACGIPIISSNIAALREMVVNNWNGLSVPVASPRMIATAIDLLRREPAIAEKLASNARQTVVEKFSLDQELNNWERLLP